MEGTAPPGDPRPPETRPGCAWAAAIACGAILVLAALAAGGVYLEMGRVIPHLEASFVGTALARSRPDDEVQKQIDAMLDEYQEAARAADLAPAGWWAAGRAFERSPAAAVLEIRVILADLRRIDGLTPQDIDRGQEALNRLLRGVAEGKISGNDYRVLLVQAAGRPAAAAEDEVHNEALALGREVLLKLFEKAGKLADERGVEVGPFKPDLATLIRLDLFGSLAAGKR